MNDSSWKVYRADGRSDAAMIARWLDRAPPWRVHRTDEPPVSHCPPASPRSERRGSTYQSSSLFRSEGDDRGRDEETQINIALMLRRPILVTGTPGLGKSSLAYHLAWALGLGEPLRWEINSRTSLADGLYTYDAVDHLRAIQEKAEGGENEPRPIGDFITLGPLGTALLPTRIPRVLLVDELDKASFDLPNDLLHVFEEGEYTIPELIRAGSDQDVLPFDPTADGERVRIRGGRVRTMHHPVVVITSNAEREFPPAFLRRCVPLELRRPGDDHMAAIVRNQLPDVVGDLDDDALAGARARYSDEATDVILQALYLENEFDVPQQRVERGLKRH